MNKVFTSFTALVCLALSVFADRAMPGIWQVKKLADGTESPLAYMAGKTVEAALPENFGRIKDAIFGKK